MSKNHMFNPSTPGLLDKLDEETKVNSYMLKDRLPKVSKNS